MNGSKGPNTFIIGATKAATTSLSSLLETHPRVGIAHGKETHFFSQESLYVLGWSRYLTFYSHCRDERVIVDGSTSYSRIRHHPAVVGRIKTHVPHAKIIYMVRHPLKRMESAYVELACTRGRRAFASINEAVQTQPMIIDSSRYWEVFDAYRQKFDESKIKIVWFEEYVADQLRVFQDVCRFLEIDDGFVPDFARERVNSGDEVEQRLERLGRRHVSLNKKWDEKVRRWVIDQIREDNCQFLDHFGRPRNHWGNLF